jgi:hypothetical protein
MGVTGDQPRNHSKIYKPQIVAIYNLGDSDGAPPAGYKCREKAKKKDQGRDLTRPAHMVV